MKPTEPKMPRVHFLAKQRSCRFWMFTQGINKFDTVDTIKMNLNGGEIFVIVTWWHTSMDRIDCKTFWQSQRASMGFAIYKFYVLYFIHAQVVNHVTNLSKSVSYFPLLVLQCLHLYQLRQFCCMFKMKTGHYWKYIFFVFGSFRTMIMKYEGVTTSLMYAVRNPNSLYKHTVICFEVHIVFNRTYIDHGFTMLQRLFSIDAEEKNSVKFEWFVCLVHVCTPVFSFCKFNRYYAI